MRLTMALFASLFLGGCGHYWEFGYSEDRTFGRGELGHIGRRGQIVTFGPPAQNVVYVYGGSAGASSEVVQPPPRDRSPRAEELRGFDPIAARMALSAVDVSSCPPSTSSERYGHARVTMSPDGRITKVTIDHPEGLAAEAIECIGERLGGVRVEPFRGSYVTVATTFRLR